MIENTKPEMTDVDVLVCHPDNPRLGNVSMIVESIQHNGWYGTVIAQKSTKFVLAGNHRLKAAREIGIDRVPVIWLDIEDDKARRILLADNRTSDLATYDDEILAELLNELNKEPVGLFGTAYDDRYLKRLLADLGSEEQPMTIGNLDSKTSIQRYETTDLRQILLLMNAEEYEFILGIFEQVMEAEKLDSNFEVVNWLSKTWLDQHGDKDRL